MAASLPANEAQRLDALLRLGILDTPREERFDRVTRLAALALNCPIACISLVDRDRVWFKSMHGIELQELPRDEVSPAIAHPEKDIVVVNNSGKDPHFIAAPFVGHNPRIRFYACAPLLTDDGLAIGSLCLADFKSRQWGEREIALLGQFAVLVREQLRFGVHADEREKTERELVESEGRFREAFDNAPIGLALIALDGKYQQVNRAMCEMLGYSADELRSMSFNDITHPDDIAADIPQLERVRAGEIKTFSLEKRYFHKRGNLVWVALNSTLLRAANGKALYFIAQLQDITERRESERIKSDFLATAAHELRSPLASVYGFSELLLQQEFKTEKRRELLEIIHNQSHHMTLLINELLDLARMEAKAGRDFTMTQQPPGRLVEEVVREFMLPPNRDPVIVHIAADLPDICVDHDKAQQALINILSNAFKYSPKGGPVILSVTLDPDGEAIAIRVRDQGIGIPRAALSRVFERFFRVEESSVSGTGLGMTLVKEIIERQGGSVRVDSELGKWTEVTVLLPVAR
jgi:PAS domain S-box-containing protein